MFGVGVIVWGVIIAINLKKLHMKIAEGTFRALWETLWASHTISAWLTQNPVTSAALTKRKRSRVRILLPLFSSLPTLRSDFLPGSTLCLFRKKCQNLLSIVSIVLLACLWEPRNVLEVGVTIGRCCENFVLYSAAEATSYTLAFNVTEQKHRIRPWYAYVNWRFSSFSLRRVLISDPRPQHWPTMYSVLSHMQTVSCKNDQWYTELNLLPHFFWNLSPSSGLLLLW